jgi:hypothetical protein
MISLFDAGHVLPDINNDARALMSQDRWEDAFRVGARQREFVRVTDTSGFHFHQDLTFPWPVQLDGFNGKRFTRFMGDSGACLHGIPPRKIVLR